jgi:hypothetical protein
MSSNLTRPSTPLQQDIVNKLVERWKIDPEKILFKRKKPSEPWLNYDALTIIARGSGAFSSLSEHYATFVPELKHIVHSATVVDAGGFTFTRSGVAEIGEVTIEGEEVDEHNLAATRALRAVLDSAGFDVVKASSVIPIDLNLPKDEQLSQDETNARNADLRAIHAIAEEKGLITASGGRKDMSGYRAWLAEEFGVESAAGLSAATRAIVINKLRQMPAAASSITH